MDTQQFTTDATSNTTATSSESNKEETFITAYDQFGRKVHIPRREWIDKVLPSVLQDNWVDPNGLYGKIMQAFDDDLHHHVQAAAEQLHKIDTFPDRGATILAICYMKTGQLDLAEQVLNDYLDQHGDAGIILTNLAKVYSYREEEDKAQEMLERALALDPNIENALDWYAAMMASQKGGRMAALQRVAAHPNSWMAQVWLAREYLEQNDLSKACELYRESLSRITQPVDTMILQQISGQLGQAGFLQELIDIVEPHYDAQVHGLAVGNNLIKAQLELGNLLLAKGLVEELHTLQRPDWKDTLEYWDHTIAATQVEQKSVDVSQLPTPEIFLVDTPLWRMEGLLEIPVKSADAVHVGIFGSNVIYPEEVHGKATLQDPPGKLSQSFPILLAEILQMETSAIASALLLRVKNHGFAVTSFSPTAEILRSMSNPSGMPTDYMAGFVVKCVDDKLKLSIELYRTTNGSKIGVVEREAAVNDSGPAVALLIQDFKALLFAGTNEIGEVTTPAWYQLPPEYLSEYLLRTGQLLTISYGSDNIYGEREILDGTIQLCVNNPDNEAFRSLLARCVRRMKEIRPHIVQEQTERLEKLKERFPLTSSRGKQIDQAF